MKSRTQARHIAQALATALRNAHAASFVACSKRGRSARISCHYPANFFFLCVKRALRRRCEIRRGRSWIWVGPARPHALGERRVRDEGMSYIDVCEKRLSNSLTRGGEYNTGG